MALRQVNDPSIACLKFDGFRESNGRVMLASIILIDSLD